MKLFQHLIECSSDIHFNEKNITIAYSNFVQKKIQFYSKFFWRSQPADRKRVKSIELKKKGVRPSRENVRVILLTENSCNHDKFFEFCLLS